MDEDQKREDFESIEPELNRTFESNDKISDEFKDLARACFGRIFYMLGEKKFRRWVDMKQMNKQIKELVIDSMPKEYLEKHPCCAGYYTPGTNQIRLSPKTDKDLTKDANVHETFHLITDKKNKFCTFLDEGLTEYMKGMAINKLNAYANNVKFVKYMHEILGDSVIKAYLTGQPNIFDEQMLDLINYDNTSSMSDVKNFYKNLNIFHDYEASTAEKEAFKQNGASPEIIKRSIDRLNSVEKQYKQVKPEVLMMFQKIIVGRISQMAKNMEFYKKSENGLELDLEGASRIIMDSINKLEVRTFWENRNTDEDVTEWERQTGALAAEQILENSHVLIGYTEQECENRKKELAEKMILTPTIIKIKNDRRVKLTMPSIKNSDITPTENYNIPLKLLEAHLDENMDITQYIQTAGKIAKITQIDDKELELYLNEFNIQYFGDVENFKKVNETIHLVRPKVQKLSEIEEQREKDTISSQYKSIGNGRFIEKRDNQIFFSELKENGEFSEQEIKLPRECIELKDGTKIEIDFEKGLPNLEVKINGITVKNGRTLSLQDIKDMEVADAFSKDIEKNIRNGKYTRILDDAEKPWETEGIDYTADIDKRSREIIFDQYISDLKSILKIIPESQKNDFIESKSEMLLDETFRIPKKRESDGTMKRNEAVENEYERFSNIISSSVEKDSVGKLESAAIKHVLEVLSSNKALEEVPKSFDCSPFYKHEGEIPLDEMPFYLKGVTTTQSVDSRNVKFSYNNFAEATISLLSKYPKKIHDSLFEEIFNKQMKETFLVSDEVETKPEITEALNNVRDALDDKIFSGVEIDDEKISESLSILSNNRTEIIKEESKKIGVQFDSKDAENMFNSFVGLIDIVKKSGITSGEVTDMIKGIMSVQMEKEEGKENKDDTAK